MILLIIITPINLVKKKKRTVVRKTWTWPSTELFHLTPYVHRSKSSGERKITFFHKKHFFTQSL